MLKFLMLHFGYNIAIKVYSHKDCINMVKELKQDRINTIKSIKQIKNPITVIKKSKL